MFYNGSSYVSLTNGNIGNQPNTSPTQWALLAQQGATGATGPAGPAGPQGPQGPAGTGTINGVTAGADLIGGGTTGTVTLNLDTTKVPLLAGFNTFTAGQTIVSASNFDGLDSYATNAGRAGVVGVSTATSGGSIGVVGGTADSSGYGVYGSNGTAGGTAVYGAASGGAGIYGSATNGTGVYGTTSGTAGVYGLAQGGGIGVGGESTNDADFAPGVLGTQTGSTHKTIGVMGETPSNLGAGVYGQNQTTQSGEGSFGCCAGVWGDGGANNTLGYSEFGVLGTTDNGTAAEFFNSSIGYYTLYVKNVSFGGPALFAGSFSGSCVIDGYGDINCTGSKSAIVPLDGGQRKVALYAVESPKNWFEDFGSEQLSSGSATITLDADFAQTVNTERNYHVYLTPNGDCKGLYVTHKTATSFEVHELGGGTSNVTFDYRIIALRKNYENIRLADHTNDPDPGKDMEASRRENATPFDINKLRPQKRLTGLARPAAEPVKK